MLAKEGEGNDITQRSRMLLAISLQSGISGHLRQIPLKKKKKKEQLFILFPFFFPSPSLCIQTVKYTHCFPELLFPVWSVALNIKLLSLENNRSHMVHPQACWDTVQAGK